MSDNGLVRPDPGILTPNDLKRLRAAAGGQSPQEILAEAETMFQGIIYCLRSRTDPAYTFEAAGDVPLNEVFDMSPDVPPPTPPSGGPGTRPGTSGGPGSRSTRKSSAAAPSSAPTTASAAPSTTS